MHIDKDMNPKWIGTNKLGLALCMGFSPIDMNQREAKTQDWFGLCGLGYYTLCVIEGFRCQKFMADKCL